MKERSQLELVCISKTNEKYKFEFTTSSKTIKIGWD